MPDGMSFEEPKLSSAETLSTVVEVVLSPEKEKLPSLDEEESKEDPPAEEESKEEAQAKPAP